MNGYSATLEYLYGLEKFGIVFGLDNINWILSLIGNPQHALKTIHVAGTNGKGSVTRMISGVLQEAGYRVGRYTSPHLVSFTERIVINDTEITQEEIVLLTRFIRERTDASDPSRTFTFFDFTTALAFEYFRRQRVDIAVIEVGLGGRLDSTNVIRPLVSLITNVELDHMDYLGDSIIDIAREKAGILKPGVPAVTGAEGVALDVICEGAAGTTPLFVLNRDFFFSRTGDQTMSYQGLKQSLVDVTVGLAGLHQLSNCALALCALELAADSGFPVSEGEIRAALAKCSWPGRLEVLRQRPTILLDAAHNPHGAKALAAHLTAYYPGRRKILVFGVMKDKDFSSMLAELAPLADEVVLTRPRIDRSAAPQDLLPVAGRGHVVDRVGDALMKAREMAGEDDVIVVTGSFYTVGEARSIIEQLA